MGDAPRRVRLSRACGWRMPAGTVKVDRSTKWGNPFRVPEDGKRSECVDLFRHLLAGAVCLSARASVDEQLTYRARVLEDGHELEGKSLACWCPLDAPCHADVLLTLRRGPTVALEAVAGVVERVTFRVTREAELQAGIAEALARARYPYQAEARLSDADRVDFLVFGRVALEAKVDGSRADVLRQCQRYARAAKVASVLLVTTRAQHRGLPEALNGKPLRVVYLPSAIL